MGVTFIAPQGVYTAPAKLVSKTITENNTYNAIDDNANGYSSVTVNVEGGGGASDFTTAEVTITNNTGSDIYIALPVMSDRRNYIYGGIAMAANSTKPPFLIVLYKGTVLGSIVTGNPQSAVCTGDITVRDGSITIQGNGTITFGTAS